MGDKVSRRGREWMLKKRGNGKWEKGKGEMGEEAAYYSGVDSTAQYSTVGVLSI